MRRDDPDSERASAATNANATGFPLPVMLAYDQDEAREPRQCGFGMKVRDDRRIMMYLALQGHRAVMKDTVK